MTIGQSVTVKTFDKNLITCRLVDVRKRTAIVCSEAEWVLAKSEKREPTCVGWPLGDVQNTKGVTAS